MSTSSRPAGRRYNMGDHGHSETSERFGNYLLKSGAGGEVWKPSYTGGKTVIRIFPGKNPDDPLAWDPFRFSNEPRQFGDWVRRYPAVRSMGDSGVTFIIKDPLDESIQLEMTPAWVLFRAVDRLVAARKDPGWGGYLKGGSGRGAQLPRPADVYLVQCCIAEHKGKPRTPYYGATDDKLVVMELGPSAGRALLELCDTVREGYTGPSDDYNAMYESGDIINPAAGRYVTFYPLKDGDPRQQQAGVRSASEAFGQSGRSRSGGGGGGGQEEIGFGCYVDDNYMGIPAAITGIEQQVRTKVRLWDDILRFPTLEEQAAMLATRFPPDMICYAWQDFPHWIPETVSAKARGRQSVAMGGYGGPAGGQGGFGDPPAGFVPPQPQLPQQPPQGGFGAPVYQQPPVQQPPVQQPPLQGGFGAPAQQQQPPQGGFAPQQPPQGGFAPQQPPQGGFAPQQQPQGGFAPQQQPPQGAGFGVPPVAGFGAPQVNVQHDGSVPPVGIPAGVGTATPPTEQPVSPQPDASAPAAGGVAGDALARARQAARRT